MKNALFTKDGKWFLIPEIPEKPRAFSTFTYPPGTPSPLYDNWKKEYDESIANALPVANPDICPQNLSEVEEGKFYQWPGTFEVKEVETVEDGGGCYVAGAKEVAILILPAAELEKEVTTYNSKIYIDGDFNDNYEARIQRLKNKGKKNKKEAETPTIASGSVAAPKEDEERCPTCGNRWGADEGKFCSNSWHLATPYIMKQVAGLQSKLSSLRDQLREKDELIKELIESIIGMKEQIQALGYYPESLSNSIDSLIKKSQKL